MSTNQYSAGRTVQFTASGAVSSNDVVELTDCIGVAAADVANGDEGTAYVEGAFTIAKTTGAAWTAGQKLWWNSGTSKATTSVTSIFAGMALVDAASGDTTGIVKLMGPTGSVANANTLIATTKTLTMTDLDAAASETALNVIVLANGRLGLVSENAGNADSYFNNTDDTGSFLVADSTAGVALYFDEDGATDERLLAVIPTLMDAYLEDSAGRLYKVKYSATPGTPGVALYFDDNGADVSARVKFVSPTNASGTVTSSALAAGIHVPA